VTSLLLKGSLSSLGGLLLLLTGSLLNELGVGVQSVKSILVGKGILLLSGFVEGLSFLGLSHNGLDFVGVDDSGEIGVGEDGSGKLEVLLLTGTISVSTENSVQ